MQPCHESISTHSAPCSLLARYLVITGPLNPAPAELRALLSQSPLLGSTPLTNPLLLSHLPLHTLLHQHSRTGARGCSSQLNSPGVPQEGPYHDSCPNTSPSAGVPWTAAVSCHVCSVPLVGGTASPLPWGTSCHTFALGFKPAPFDVTC